MQFPNLSMEGWQVRLSSDVDSGLVWGFYCHYSFVLALPEFSDLVGPNLHPNMNPNLRTQKSYLCCHLALYFFLFRIVLPICCYWIAVFIGSNLSQGVHTLQYFGGLNVWRLSSKRLSGWCCTWLGSGGGLLSSFSFFDFDCGEPITLHEIRMLATFIFLGLENLSILGLVRVSSWCFLAGMALGLAWYDLLAKGVAMVCFHLRYSMIFHCRDGKAFISFPQGLHLVTWKFLSLLYIWIPHRVWTFISTSIMSSGRLYEKNPERNVQFGANFQTISVGISIYILCCFRSIVECQSKPNHALL